MEFHCSILPSETHPGPWVFTLRQIKTLCQDISQESFWYPRHETFITSPKLIEKFHDSTQIKHEVNALFQSHWDPQGSENAQRLGATLHGQDVMLQEQDPGLSVQSEGSSTSGTTFPVNAFSRGRNAFTVCTVASPSLYLGSCSTDIPTELSMLEVSFKGYRSRERERDKKRGVIIRTDFFFQTEIKK